MRLGTSLFFLVFSVSVGCATAVGCSDDGVVGQSHSVGGVGGSIHACLIPDGGPHAEPPPPPDAASPPNGTGTVTFAVSTFFFGDTDRDGGADKLGWKQFGFDLDGKNLPPCAPGLCRVPDPPPLVPRAEGFDGIDNAFGHDLLPILVGINSVFSQKVADTFAQGTASTILISIDALDSSTDATGLTARLYAGAPLGHAPANDGTDAWPVRPETLASPIDLGSAKLEVASAYIVNDTFVARFTGALPIELPFIGRSLHLSIENPIVSMQLDAQHQSAENGTVAGVLDPDAVAAEFRRIAGDYDPSLCSGPTIDSIATQIAQASDIMADFTQDPTKTCNAISIGLGFNAARAQLGVIAAPEVIDSPCAPDGGANTDGG
jgi:hypothetical protein